MFSRILNTLILVVPYHQYRWRSIWLIILYLKLDETSVRNKYLSGRLSEIHNLIRALFGVFPAFPFHRVKGDRFTVFMIYFAMRWRTVWFVT